MPLPRVKSSYIQFLAVSISIENESELSADAASFIVSMSAASSCLDRMGMSLPLSLHMTLSMPGRKNAVLLSE